MAMPVPNARRCTSGSAIGRCANARPGSQPSSLATPGCHAPKGCVHRQVQAKCSPHRPVVYVAVEQAARGTVHGRKPCVWMTILRLVDLGIDHNDPRSVADADLADTWGQSAHHFVGDRAWDASRDG